VTLTLGELVGYVDLDNSKFEKGLDDSESKFDRFAGGLKTASTAAGVAAAGALGAALAESMNVEVATDRMAAQLDLTAAEADRVGDLAGTLFANAYGGSIEEVNEALRGVIAQTGDLGDLTDEELTDMGAKALDLASILGEDVVRVTQVAGQAVRNGLADNMTEAFDLIASASANTMPGLQADLLDAADEYGQFFAQLGIDGPAAFGMLAKGSEQGMYGIDKTGDAIKEFTILAADMSQASQDAYATIGLDAEEMSAKVLAGGDTAADAFGQIVDGLLAIKDPVAQQTAALALFGTPLEDLSTGQIPEFLAALDSGSSALDDVGGAADRMGATLNDNAATAFSTFGRSVQTEFIEGMEPLLPMLQGLANFLMPLAPILLPIAAAIALVTAVQWLWNAAMLANPIGLIIIAIVALIAIVLALVHNWDSVVESFKHSGELLKEGVIMAFNAIRDFFVQWWPWIFAIMTGGLSLIVACIIDHWDEIKQTTSDVWNAILGFFKDIWNKIVVGVQVQVAAVLAVIAWFKDLPGRIRTWFGQVKDGAVEKLSSMVDWVKGLPGRIISAVGNIGSLLLSKGENVIDGLLNGMKNAAGAVKDWIWGLLEDIAGSVKDFFGIASPSRLMAGYGENIGQGLAKGIKASLAGVSVAADVLASAAMPQLAPAAAPAVATLAADDRRLLAAGTRQRPAQNFTVNAADQSPEELAAQLDWLSRRRP
jgi:phage-related minor tail protein